MPGAAVMAPRHAQRGQGCAGAGWLLPWQGPSAFGAPAVALFIGGTFDGAAGALANPALGQVARQFHTGGEAVVSHCEAVSSAKAATKAGICSAHERVSIYEQFHALAASH